jgi:hypothetical protein
LVVQPPLWRWREWLAGHPFPFLFLKNINFLVFFVRVTCIVILVAMTRYLTEFVKCFNIIWLQWLNWYFWHISKIFEFTLIQHEAVYNLCKLSRLNLHLFLNSLSSPLLSSRLHNKIYLYLFFCSVFLDWI